MDELQLKIDATNRAVKQLQLTLSILRKHFGVEQDSESFTEETMQSMKDIFGGSWF